MKLMKPKGIPPFLPKISSSHAQGRQTYDQKKRSEYSGQSEAYDERLVKFF